MTDNTMNEQLNPDGYFEIKFPLISGFYDIISVKIEILS